MNPAYIATSGWVASALGAAAALGVADLLAGEPRSVAEIAAATQTSESTLRPILRLLAQVGVFAEDAAGRFANTPDSEILRTNHPYSQRYFCQLAAGDYQRLFLETLQVARTGESAARRVFGESLYDHWDNTAAGADIYDRAMEDFSRPVAAFFAATRSFAGARLVADIGGGRGTMVKAVLRANPNLRGMVVDRPGVCARARAELAVAEPALLERLEYVSGDFFTAVPAGADVYLLKNVLHNFGDESALGLLRVIAKAMHDTAAARLVVIEPQDTPPLSRRLDDLLRVVVCEEGSEWRSVNTLETLLQSAGFGLLTTAQAPGGMAFLEFEVAESLRRAGECAGQATASLANSL